MSIIDRIRKQLDQPDALTIESLQPLAEAYGAETRQANERLSDCIQMLRKGLRSEAIQRASMKPNLLDWCAELDFPEVDDWLEIIQFYGITVPPLLDRDAALQLQEAIVDEQPLDELLRQHRRLAIAKAPLSWRLKVLRRLAEIDSVNSVWQEDQKEWEVIRLKQIPVELTKAIETASLDEIQELSAELMRPDWLIIPPKELCKKATDAAKSMIYKAQLAKIKKLTEDLHAAYSEGDEQAAERRYDAWQQFARSMVSPPPPDLAHSIEPAVEWIKECRATREKMELFELRSSVLENLLLDGRPLAELERAYYEVASLQMGIDPLLEQKYDTRVNELRQASRRRTQIRVIAIAASALIVLVGVGLWQWRRTHQGTVGDAINELQGLVAMEDFQAADGLVSKLPPEVLNEPEVIALVESLKTKKTSEIERAERVSQLISETEVEDPSRIDINKLRLAEKEAKTDEEKLRVKKVRSAFDDFESSIREQQTEAVKQAVAKFSSRLKQIEQLPVESDSESEIDTLVLDLNKLTSEYPKSFEARDLVELTVKQAEAIKSGLRSRKQELSRRQSSMRGLRNAASLLSFTAAIKNYAENLPQDPLTKQLKQALQEEQLWQNVESWSSWCDKAKSAAEDGKLVLDELKRLNPGLKSAKSGLGLSSVESLDSEIEGIIRATDNRQKILDEVPNRIKLDSDFGMLVTVRIPGPTGRKDTRRFITYTTRESEAAALSTGSKIRLSVIKNQQFQTEEVELRGKLVIVDEPRATVRKLLRRLSSGNIFVQDWEDQFVSVIGDMTKEPNLDSQLKELLIEQIVKIARQGSHFMDESFKKVEEVFADTEDKRIAWYLGTEVNSEVSKPILDSLREAVQKMVLSRQELVQKVQALSKARLHWVGGVLPTANKSGNELWLHRGDIADGTLFQLLPVGSSNSNGRLDKVGSVVGGKASLSVPESALLAGRPLFHVPANNSKD